MEVKNLMQNKMDASLEVNSFYYYFLEVVGRERTCV